MDNADQVLLFVEPQSGVWQSVDHVPFDQWAEEKAAAATDSATAAPAALSPAKRALDLLCAAIALLFLFPPLLIVALIVRTTSAGPVLFRQVRTGYNGRPFELLKFRTMYVSENDSLRHTTRSDPRVTPVGAFLRASSIDELPQLLNVLKGDMSLVGPRPHALAHDSHYSQLVQDYPKRFAVRPGLTGLAQVRGFRGEIYDISCMERRVEADCEYIDQWSLMRDIHIIAQTVPLILRDPNAY